MSLGLFRKSLALHQWIANKCGMKVYVGPKQGLTLPFSGWDSVFPTRFPVDYHYMTTRALETLGEQLKGQPGSVAEVGVWTGDFSRIINRVFPDRELLLYDTWDSSFMKCVIQGEKTLSSLTKVLFTIPCLKLINRQSTLWTS
ncbi:MAG: hypothetical protein LBD66_02785 [Holosporales bacterium]|jgi:hypothetical protein|nr:hypothetical protein [Holosporales bacterium]